VNRILKLPDVKQRLDLMGAEHVSLSAREAHELLQREYERWGKIIRESGIKAD
jgi:tripartite-type tricarboxylate transporter receptor subunit TctC